MICPYRHSVFRTLIVFLHFDTESSRKVVHVVNVVSVFVIGSYLFEVILVVIKTTAYLTVRVKLNDNRNLR